MTGRKASDKVTDYLAEMMSTGQLRKGSILPPERYIAQKFSISRIPVRQAMQKFIDRGILERKQGQGTFVKNLGTIRTRTNKLAILHCHSEYGLFNSSYYSPILAGIEKAAGERKKTLVFGSLVRPDGENPVQEYYDLLDDVDGFIIIDPLPSILGRIEDTLRDSKKPVVAVNYEPGLRDIDTVAADSEAGTGEMIRLLIGQGHRRIAFTSYYPDHGGGQVHPNLMIKEKAYRETLEENGIQYDAALVRRLLVPGERVTDGLIDKPFEIGDTHKKDADVIEEMLRLPDPPTAFYSMGDPDAVYVYSILMALGYRVPEDVSVAGHGNVRQCQAVSKGLTTVQAPLVEMGSRAVKRVLEKMEERSGGEDGTLRTLLPCRLVERGTHGNPPLKA